MTMPDQVSVTQEDREAAAALRRTLEGRLLHLDEVKYADGRYDTSAEVQAFARNRRAAIQKARADALKPVEAFIKLHTTTDDSGHVVACTSPSLTRWQIFAAAIRSLTEREVSREG